MILRFTSTLPTLTVKGRLASLASFSSLPSLLVCLAAAPGPRLAPTSENLCCWSPRARPPPGPGGLPELLSAEIMKQGYKHYL